MRSILFVFACLLAAAAHVNAAEQQPLSPEAAARIAPLFDAYARVDQELAALPPAKDDAERLMRLGRLDDVGRATLRTIDFLTLPPMDGRAAVMAAQMEVERRDAANRADVKAMLPPEGWFLKSKYGASAARAAWAIVHHGINSDIEFVRTILANMAQYLDTDEIDKEDYAMLFDRVALADGVRQTYGTQMICDNFKWMLYPVADEASVEERRKKMGMSPLSEQLAQFETRSCPVAKYNGPMPE